MKSRNEYRKTDCLIRLILTIPPLFRWIQIIKMLQVKNCSQYPDNCNLCLDVRTTNCGLGVAEGG